MPRRWPAAGAPWRGGARYTARRCARSGAFEAPTPLGVAVPAGRGVRYSMYSFAPDLRVLNGELQTLIGLRDVARISGSARAQRLFARAEPAARRAVRGFDTGAWSLYSADGKESTLGYHRLVAGFLAALCRRTGAASYCAAGRRFARYVREPPRVHVRTLRKVRVRRQATIRFTLSKISDVMLQVRDRRGRVELSRGLRALPRGRHSVAWVPERAGRHRLRIVAVGPAGTRAVVGRTLRAKVVKRPGAASAAAKRSPSPRGDLDHGLRAPAGPQPPRRDGAVVAHDGAGVVEPQEVQREAHADRVHRAAALEEQAVAGGQRVEAGEAAPPRAPVAGHEQRQAAGQRPALERRQARVERHGARRPVAVASEQACGASAWAAAGPPAASLRWRFARRDCARTTEKAGHGVGRAPVAGTPQPSPRSRCSRRLEALVAGRAGAIPAVGRKEMRDPVHIVQRAGWTGVGVQTPQGDDPVDVNEEHRFGLHLRQFCNKSASSAQYGPVSR